MRNPLKRTDIFICNYKGHERFEHRVSAYHVMQQKKCYPQGCIIFKWSCRLKDRGKSCVRGYNYVGRLCEGCAHYEDEKINYQPRIKVEKQEFELFLQEVEEFNDWVSEYQNREMDIWCEIVTIKPRFKKQVYGKGGQIRLDGYLLIIQNGFIGQTGIDDFFYVHISPNQQDRLRFAAGDQFEAKGKFALDKGRILFDKIWHVDFEYRSGKQTWNNSRALVARQTATRFENQSDTCLHCPHGALVDVIEKHNGRIQTFRELYCFEGIQDQNLCYVNAKRVIDHCNQE